MGKGKKERSKKNKNKKETREPIKRKFEGKKHCVPTHPICTSVENKRGKPVPPTKIVPRGKQNMCLKDMQLYEQMFGN